MTNNSKIQVDYTTKTKNCKLVFPINFEINIPADDSVRLLGNVLEETEITLLCLAYNIQKLHNNTIANRQGQLLHEIKAT